MMRSAAMLALALAACVPPPEGIRPAMPPGAVELEVGVHSDAVEDRRPLVRASVWSVRTAGVVEISGTIHDQTRSGVANAVIAVPRVEDKILDVVLSDETGAFHVTLRGPGTYAITLYCDDFTSDLSPIALAANTTTHLDITVDVTRVPSGEI